MNNKVIEKNKEKVLKQAWLVSWGCQSQDEEEYLSRFGITTKYIDILSVRKDFDKYIVEYAKNIYQVFMLSLKEKIYFADYSKGMKNREEYFKRIPIWTHYNSDLYRKLMKSLDKGFGNAEFKELSKKWKEGPQYVIVGHNPYLQVIKVYNVRIEKDERDVELIKWDRRLVNGEYKTECVDFNKMNPL